MEPSTNSATTQHLDNEVIVYKAGSSFDRTKRKQGLTQLGVNTIDLNKIFSYSNAESINSPSKVVQKNIVGDRPYSLDKDVEEIDEYSSRSNKNSKEAISTEVLGYTTPRTDKSSTSRIMNAPYSKYEANLPDYIYYDEHAQENITCTPFM